MYVDYNLTKNYVGKKKLTACLSELEIAVMTEEIFVITVITEEMTVMAEDV